MKTSFKYEVQIAVFQFNYTIHRRCIGDNFKGRKIFRYDEVLYHQKNQMKEFDHSRFL